MNTRTTPGRLFDLWRRRHNDAPLDAADVGTAFGLELTLIPGDEESAPPVKRRSAGSRWLRRLMRKPD